MYVFIAKNLHQNLNFPFNFKNIANLILKLVLKVAKNASRNKQFFRYPGVLPRIPLPLGRYYILSNPPECSLLPPPPLK